MSSKTTTAARAAASESYRVRVELQDIEPVIWRSVQVPASLSLAGLHKALQIAMGWEDCHMHQFLADDGRCFGVADQELERRDHHGTSVGEVLRPGRELVYEYDFGDCWRHRLTVEEVVSDPVRQVLLLDGARACPPEDAGGSDGFMDLLEFFDPESTCDMCEEEKEYGGEDQCTECWETRQWLGDFDPGEFRLARVAARLAKARL
ncbi:plasmid pRiA4b ORF-3 family protein [Streptacidiphilus sp. N1-3]|uniref:Plasmid pRiA4b ORF-3 family protein n=1 Tax=Streptacidiphilus alkalitolerans TaxID=3342712 RepID=A0ABV6XCH5_9ACTN